ncbi:MAG: GNAT family N-acetyltransferase [Legionellales bacterium]|nr:GNAT family N-acetyltransferase [Legionellales bacterium]
MTTHSPKFYFYPINSEYQKIILTWFNEDHVKEFYYGEGLQNTLHNIELYCQGIRHNGRYAFDHWIAYLEDKPLGFLMTSPVMGPYDSKDDVNKWYIEGKKIVTLDLLIGPKEFIGKGLAHKMIQAFILDKFVDADFFLIDPALSNPKAIHVYEKAGFKKLTEFCPAYDPVPHLMMRLEVKELASSHHCG